MAYDVGQQVRIPVEVRDVAGVLTDATMTFAASRDDGTAYPAPAVVHDSTGKYHVDLTVDASGLVDWQWTASGAITAVYTGQIYVRSGLPGIISLAEGKKHLNKRLDDTSDDDEIRDWIDAITYVIESRVGAVTPRSVTEVHSGGTAFVYLRHGPVLAVTSVSEEQSGAWVTILPEPQGGPYTDDQYVVDLNLRQLIRRGSGYARRWGAGYGNVAVSFMVGRRPTPPNFRTAAFELLAHHWRASQLVSGGSRPREGTPDTAGIGIAIPNRVLVMLAGAKRAPLLGRSR